MQCADAREAVSAGLDDEERPGEAAALDAHLAGCAACRHYVDRAARITRLTRTRAVEPGPDLVAAVCAAAPPATPRIDAGAVRLGLGAVGIGQCALAISGIVGVGGRPANVAHMSHESAAWNLALGVGFLWVATGTARRTSGLVALVGVFVGVLAVLSLLDLVAGRVDPVRLGTHLLVVAGLVLLLVVTRVDRRDGGGSAGKRRSHELGRAGEPAGGPAPAAHHRVA
jgi:predicted anti-sigma-YlaC factor YlaD